MPERERRAPRAQGHTRRGETVGAAQSEALIERSIGEGLLAPAGTREPESLLRPQQNRSAVWRWHVRRRRES